MKLLVFVIAVFIAYVNAQNVDTKLVKCLVCRTIVDEFLDEVNKIDPSKSIEIGQYRLDSQGNAIQKKVQLATSQIHLMDLLETICKKMDDYVRATYKSNGKLILLKLVSSSGLNPLLNEVDVIQDGDLNKSVEYFCKEIVNEHEDALIEIISKKLNNPKVKLCTEEAEYCSDFPEDIDEEYDDTSDNNDFKDEL